MPTGKKISIIGTVGLPANYGGFETLVENLVTYHHRKRLPSQLTVYCSSNAYPEKKTHFLSAELRYIALRANGTQSILYDVFSLLSALARRSDTIILLGVSGAIALPLVKTVSSAQVITNIDGIEWQRGKWRGLAKQFLRISERLAVRWSDTVIADNGAIAEYVKHTYNIVPHVLAYGGDHAIQAVEARVPQEVPSSGYSLAVCRIEPENNVHMILQASAASPSHQLVFVGNWNNSGYGRELRRQYSGHHHILMLDPIYDLGVLKSLRTHARLYIHGHSAGGTNPSLVEAMHFGIPVLAYDCSFNRSTTEEQAIYFKSTDELASAIVTLSTMDLTLSGRRMKEIALRRYTWETIAQQYFELADSEGITADSNRVISD